MRFVRKTHTQVLTSVDEPEQERPPEKTAEPQLLGTFHSRVHLLLFPQEKTLLFNPSAYIFTDLFSLLRPSQLTRPVLIPNAASERPQRQSGARK